MFGKNNFKERLRQMDEKHDRFSIRKLTIGAASVLIGSVLFGMGVDSNQVKAATKPATELAAKKDDNAAAPAADSKKMPAANKAEAAGKDANKIAVPSSDFKAEASKNANAAASEQKQNEKQAVSDKSQAQKTGAGLSDTKADPKKKDDASVLASKQNKASSEKQSKTASSAQQETSDKTKDNSESNTAKPAQPDQKSNTLKVGQNKNAKPNKINSKRLAESKAVQADDNKFANNGGLDPTIWGTFNKSDWQFTGNVITGYTGNKQHIIIPNSADVGHEVDYDSRKFPLSNNSSLLTLAVSKTKSGTAKVVGNNLSGAFSYNQNLQKADLNRLDTTGVTNMNRCFTYDPSLETLDIGNWNMQSVTYCQYIFSKDTNLKAMDLTNWNFTSSAVWNLTSAFNQCPNLILTINSGKLADYFVNVKIGTRQQGIINSSLNQIKALITNDKQLARLMTADQWPSKTATATRTIVFKFPKGADTSSAVSQLGLNKNSNGDYQLVQSAGFLGQPDEIYINVAKVNGSNTQTGHIDQDKTIYSYTPQAASSKGVTINGNTATFNSVIAPSITGYTASPASESAINANAGDNIALTINYTANPRKATYTFVDDDNNGAQVGSAVTVNGVTDQKNVATKLTVPTNYVLASGQTLPTSIDFGTSDPVNVTIHLKHGTKDISKTDENKSAQTNHYRVIEKRPAQYGGDKAIIDIEITSRKQASKDLVTGKITYGTNFDSQLATFKVNAGTPYPGDSSYFLNNNIDQINGYTVNSTNWTSTEKDINNTGILFFNNDAQHATFDFLAGTPATNTDSHRYYAAMPKDQDFDITYKANARKATYTFVDDDENGSQVGSQVTVNGVTNQKNVAVNLTVPTNYVLASGQTLPTSVDFGTSDPANVTVHLKHGTQDVTMTDPKAKLTSEYRMIEDRPDGTKTVKIDLTITSHKTATKDLVTGKISYGDYDPANTRYVVHAGNPLPGWNYWFRSDKNTIDPVPGYKPDTNNQISISWKSPETDVNGNPLLTCHWYVGGGIDMVFWPGFHRSHYTEMPQSQDFHLKYIGNPQQIYYQFVDDNKKDAQGKSTNVGSAIEVDGTTDETVDPSKTVKVPAGYDLAPGQTIPDSVKLSLDNTDLGKTVEIHLKHHIITVTPSQIPDSAHNIAGDNGDKTPGDGKPLNDLTDDDIYKTVSRIIIDKGPGDAGIALRTQAVKFNRDAYIDDVTGKVTYGDWQYQQTNKESFAGYDPYNSYTKEQEDGYTPDHTMIDAYTPKPSEVDGWNIKDHSIIISWNADQQSEVINFYDDTDKKQISSKTLNGVTKQAVDTGLTAPSGYDLVSGNTIPTKYTFKGSGNDPITIHFVHHIDKGLTKTPTGGAHTADGKDVKDTDFSETITRTITAHEPQADGTFNDVPTVQKATLTRTGDFDEVTKVLSWNAWSTSSFDAYTAPIVTGYTPNHATIAAVASATDGYIDPKIVINYQANDQTETVQFWDDTDNKQIGNDYILDGKTNQTVDTNLTTPAGYDLVTGNTIPTKYTFKGSDNDPIKVHFTHGSKEIKPGDTIPHGSDPSKGQPNKDVKPTDSEHTLTRTITVNKPDGTHSTETQTIAFQRSGQIDTVTGAVSWDAWKPVDSSKDSFAAYTAPAIDGYTSGKVDVVNDVTYKTGDKDLTASVGYTANDSNFNIVYKDDKGNTIASKQIAGKTAETVPSNSISNNIPAGWVIDGTAPTLPDKFVPQDQEKDITVTVKHKIDIIDPNKPTNPDKIPTGAKNSDGSDVTKENFSEDVRRKITAEEPSGNVDLSQTVTIYRTGKYDEVAKTMTYSAWIPGTFKALNAPVVAGYTPSQGSVAAEAATDGFSKTYTITYTAHGQKMVYTYWDDTDNNKIPSTEADGNYTISGKTGNTVNTGLAMPAGYDLAAGSSLPNSYTFTSAKEQSATIHFVHHIDKNVTKTPAGGAKNPDGSDVKDSDFSKTVKRTIIAHIPAINGVAAHDQDLSQTATFTRTGNYDEVTKKMTWNDWSSTTKKFDAVTAPTVNGYTPSQATIEAVPSLTVDYIDPHISIIYTAGSESVNFNWVDDDENGAKVGSPISFSGDIGHSVNTGLNIPEGYELAGGKSDTATDIYNNIPSNYTFKSSNPDIDIHLKHKIDKDVTGDTVKPGTKTPDGKNISKDDFSETIKQTITAVEPDHNGGTVNKDLSQTIILTRTGNVDEVTKKITWNPWSTGKFDAVNAPAIAGYTPSQASVPAVATVSDGYKDPNIKITYTADKQNINYQFVDDDKKDAQDKPIDVGSAIEVDGNTDDTVDPSQKVKVPAGYDLASGQTIPTSVKLSMDNTNLGKTVTIHLVHGTKTVQPGDTPTPGTKVPGDNGHKTPGDGKPKNDINYSDLHKDITRTITDHIPGQASPTVTKQTVSYERTAAIDDVTGEVTYGDWTVSASSAKKSLGEYDVQAVDGYTPSQTKVEAETPTSEQVDKWSDPNIDITYTANVSPIGPEYPGSSVVPTNPTNQEEHEDLIFVTPTGHVVLRVPSGVKGLANHDLTKTQVMSLIKQYLPQGWRLPTGFTVKAIQVNGLSAFVTIVPAQTRTTVYFDLDNGKIVKKTIWLANASQADRKAVIAFAQANMPAGFHLLAAGQAHPVALGKLALFITVAPNQGRQVKTEQTRAQLIFVNQAGRSVKTVGLRSAIPSKHVVDRQTIQSNLPQGYQLLANQQIKVKNQEAYVTVIPTDQVIKPK